MVISQSINLLQIVLTAVFSLIVALIGLFVGLRVDRFRQRKRQERLYISVLRSIHYDYKKNLDLLCQLHAYLFVGIVPSFSLELSRKDALVQTLVPLCLNFKLLDRISDGYFELVHIQRKLEKSGTYTLIHSDIRVIFGILLEIIDEIRQRSGKGEGIDQLPEDYLKQKFDELQNDSEIVKIAQQHGTDLSKRPRFYEEGVTLKTRASGSAPPDPFF